MNKFKNSKSVKPVSKEDPDLSNIDRDLKDLIQENESLKKGITKIFKEIEQSNKTNKSN